MISRRAFLTIAPLAPVLAGARDAKPLRGIFPILQTPFTEANALDLPVLAKQVEFLHRGGVHGVVWPQLASEYATLSVEERLRGAETIVASGKPLRPAVVIGVQASDIAQAVRYARHAEKLGADGVIALPPRGETDERKILDYYAAIGDATPLPFFVQAVGNMSVDFLIRMAGRVPTIRYIKDEAGPPLPRLSEVRRKAPHLHPFTGNHGRTLLEEMARGSAGSMPAASFADLYAETWDLYQAGKRNQAYDCFARVLLLIAEVDAYGIEGLKYILQLRGVFRNSITRDKNGAARRATRIDEAGRRMLGELLDHLRPYLKADARMRSGAAV